MSLARLEAQAQIAIERCGLSPAASKAVTRSLRSDLSLGPLIAPLAIAKRELLRQGAGDSELAGVDELLSEALSLIPELRVSPEASPELFALLPTDFIGALSLEAVFKPPAEALAASPQPSPLHWLCEFIGERGLLCSSKQKDLFAPDQSAQLERSLRQCASFRPDWVNQIDHLGQTPLHWAVYFLAPEALVILLELGANTQSLNLFGSPPFDPAFFERYRRLNLSSARANERAFAVWRLMERSLLESWVEPGERGEGSKRL